MRMRAVAMNAGGLLGPPGSQARATTVLDADQKPVTSFEGTWTKVKGPSGRGTYRGRLTGPDAYVVDWQGEIELTQRAAR